MPLTTCHAWILEVDSGSLLVGWVWAGLGGFGRGWVGLGGVVWAGWFGRVGRGWVGLGGVEAPVFLGFFKVHILGALKDPTL